MSLCLSGLFWSPVYVLGVIVYQGGCIMCNLHVKKGSIGAWHILSIFELMNSFRTEIALFLHIGIWICSMPDVIFFDLFFFFNLFQFQWKTYESCLGTCLVEGTSLICEVHFTVLWLYDLVQENLCNELQRYRSENAASWNRHKIHVFTVESSQLALAVRKCSYMGICRITNPINRSWFFSFSFFFFFLFYMI